MTHGAHQELWAHSQKGRRPGPYQGTHEPRPPRPTGNSLDRLLELRHADPRVTVLALSRNFGHQIAVTAGLDAAGDADAVIVMDTDLQDPPRVSLELVRVWETGVDVV